jgi:release factor glutamine methyltransferase
LAVLSTIIAAAPEHLRAGGTLLLEHGYDQGKEVGALLAGSGFIGVFTERDLSGQPRVSGGRL